MKNENILILIILFIISSATCEEPKKNSEQKVNDLLDSVKTFTSFEFNRYARGNAYIDSIFYSKMGLLNEAEKIDSNDYRIYFYKHFFYRNSSKYDSALIYLKKAMNLNPNDPFMFNNYAYFLEFMGDTQAAKLNFKKSLELFDQLSNSRSNEFFYAKNKVYLLDILFGKDSALKYYDLMKRKFRAFDIDSSLKKSLIKYNHKKSIKDQFR